MLALLPHIGTLAAAATVPANQITGPARVIDGDTLEIHGIRIRLFGIDAPEAAQTCQTANGILWPCGAVVSRTVRTRYGGQVLTCDVIDTDRYGRSVARCHSEGTDISAALVGQGLALAYRRYSLDYVAAEDHASAAKLGLWSGTMTRPDIFRRARHRQTRN